MKKWILFFALMFCVSFLIFAQAGRNARFVAVQSANLRASSGIFASTVATLSLGDAVTLIVDNGRWSQVQHGNTTGWIQSNELSTRRIIPAGTAGITASEIALAGKGFSPETEMEYRRSGIDFSMVDFMERITVPSDDLLRFINDGGLNRGN